MTSVANPPLPTPTPTPDRADLWRRWSVATTLGELAGFAIPGVVGAVAAAAGAPAVLLAVLVVIAGAGEGYVLGTAQEPVLRAAVPGVGRGEWRRATSLGAVVAWALGMSISFLWDLPASVPLVVPIGLAALLGVALLASLPALQWRVLRERLPGAGVWVPGCMGAWAVGLAACIAIISIVVGPDTSVQVSIAAGVAGGLVMGATVAVLTGALLVTILRRADAGAQATRATVDPR